MKGDPMEPQTPREPRSDLPDEVERALKATRRIGYGLLVGAIIFDVLSVQFASVRRFCGAQLASLVDEVIPDNRPVLDLALVLLGVSDATG